LPTILENEAEVRARIKKALLPGCNSMLTAKSDDEKSLIAKKTIHSAHSSLAAEGIVRSERSLSSSFKAIMINLTNKRGRKAHSGRVLTPAQEQRVPESEPDVSAKTSLIGSPSRTLSTDKVGGPLSNSENYIDRVPKIPWSRSKSDSKKTTRLFQNFPRAYELHPISDSQDPYRPKPRAGEKSPIAEISESQRSFRKEQIADLEDTLKKKTLEAKIRGLDEEEEEGRERAHQILLRNIQPAQNVIQDKSPFDAFMTDLALQFTFQLLDNDSRRAFLTDLLRCELLYRFRKTFQKL